MSDRARERAEASELVEILDVALDTAQILRRQIDALLAEKKRLQRRLDIAEACIHGGDSYSTYRAALARDADDTEETT